MRKYETGGSTDFFNRLADNATSQYEDRLAVDTELGAEAEPTDDTEDQQDLMYGEADISPEQDYDQLLSDYNDLQAKFDNLQAGNDFVPSGSFDDGFMDYLFQDRNNLPISFSNSSEDSPEQEGSRIGDVISTLKRAVGDVNITSQYRSPQHNRDVGGAPNSFHLTGQAVDVAPNEKVNKYLTSSEGRKALEEQGYEVIDERNRKGHGAHWHLEPKQFGGYATGGSVYDYLQSKGINGSLANRKKMFGHLFNDYQGTAEQNEQLLSLLKSGRINPQANPKERTPEQERATASRRRGSTASQAGKAAGRYLATTEGSSESPIQSGVIVDKRTGKAAVVKDSKTVKTFNVLTGKNVEGNIEFGSTADNEPDTGKATPVGGYLMKGRTTDAKEYDYNILKLNPLHMKGQPTPEVRAGTLAIHQTWDAKNRDPYYGSATPWLSYGCVNCHKEDIQDVMRTFPQGDTLMVIDSKMDQYKALSKKLKLN